MLLSKTNCDRSETFDGIQICYKNKQVRNSVNVLLQQFSHMTRHMNIRDINISNSNT